MAELNIDATNAIAGRLASHVAKQALLGYTVNVFNCEKAVISGRSTAVRDQFYHRIFKTGGPFMGPFTSRMPDRFMRRIIRGMVEYKEGRGKEAYARIMCYIGVPVQFKDRKLVKVAKQAGELPKLKYQTVGELCTSMGGKV
jgi:large subunit ribosomal protein L13